MAQSSIGPFLERSSLMSRLCWRLLVVLSFALSIWACTKKQESKTVRAVPADVDVLAHIDGKPLMEYARKMMTATSAGKEGDTTAFALLESKVKEMVGIGLDQIDDVTVIGYSDPNNAVAFIVEGLKADSLKGEKRADHNGVGLYYMEREINYAPLEGLGVVAGSSQDMLAKVLDTYTGKADNVTKGNRSKVLEKFQGLSAGLDQLRVYVLNPKLPEQASEKIHLVGAGFFMHLDKGLTLTLLSDENGAAGIKAQIDQGIMAVKMMLSGGGGLGLPIKLDDEIKKALTDVLEKIEVSQSGANVSILYRSSLKPLIEKGFSFAMQKLAYNLTPEQPSEGEITQPEKKE